MIHNIETEDTAPEQAIHSYREYANVMRQLVTSDGWRLLAQSIRTDMDSAYAQMRAATTADGALASSTKYVILKDLLELPEKTIAANDARAKQLEDDLKSIVVPQHHRSQQFKKQK